ncbi:Glu-tRNA(Gln) amidotransferase subunit GatD [Oxyplasma meridianum]|uniref:Glutamyl-tRNA(Gln) amidotransferase subunit D n=1 Tax=Oxyplasma meridianum TaxID=3073602 RepID=A0AAX4NGW8_9ARCH
MKLEDQLDQGDLLEIKYGNSLLKGMYISKEKDLLIIKLENGYNLSLPSSSIEILSHVSQKRPVGLSGNGSSKIGKGKTHITIITTGGTIASRVDYSTGAVKPVKDLEFLTSSIPGITERFNLKLSEYGEILSENMTPENWISLGRSARDFMKKSDGIIITHGTDTMSYTSSALAFMFERQTTPVVFVGSQRSSDRPSSDAFLNFRGAIEFSSTDFGEVGIAMHETISDTGIALHRSVRSRKMHTSRRDAFRTIGSMPVGYSDPKGTVFREGYRKIADEISFSDRLDSKVALIYFSPTLSSEDLENVIAGRHAAIIMGTGLGHVNTDLAETIRKSSRDGIKIMMTSQCINGSVNMNVYSTGRILKDAGVIPMGSILPEVAYVKAMYVLANYPSEEFEKRMQENLRGEILEREISSQFNEGGF